jgi:TonB family protein
MSKPRKIKTVSKSKPTIEALVVTPQVRRTPEHKTPEPDSPAPELKLESKMPVIPNAPTSQIVAVGTFSAKSALMVSAKPASPVQTGGFGDVNGVPASEHRGTAKININEKGSPDLASGSGSGNGIAGTSSSVVMKSGFGNPIVMGAVKSAAIAKPSSGSNTPVEITFKPKPDYTDEGRKLGINGKVSLEVLFSADGRVHVMRVLQGLGYGLDEQAVKAAEQIKFKPALHEGQPIDSTALVHIIFELIS